MKKEESKEVTKEVTKEESKNLESASAAAVENPEGAEPTVGQEEPEITAQTGEDQIQQQNSQPKVDLIRVPLKELTKVQKKAMIIDERYTFFQIENKLRQICVEVMDSIRSRVKKEADQVRKVQELAEQARRSVSGLEPRLNKVELTVRAINSLSADIGGLQTQVAIEADRNRSMYDNTGDQMRIIEDSMEYQTQAFNVDLQSIQDVRQNVNIGLEQIQKFKEEVRQKSDEAVQKFCLHLAELQGPQRQMQIDIKELQRQTAILREEEIMRKSQQKVITERIQLAFEQIKQLQDQKLDFKDYVKFEVMTDHSLESARVRFEQIEKSLKNTIDYMLRYQWKETRNIVNRALTRVTRPLALKDLLYSNVIEVTPELWYELPKEESEESQKDKALDASIAQTPKSPSGTEQTDSNDSSSSSSETETSNKPEDLKSKAKLSQHDSAKLVVDLVTKNLDSSTDPALTVFSAVSLPQPEDQPKATESHLPNTAEGKTTPQEKLEEHNLTNTNEDSKPATAPAVVQDEIQSELSKIQTTIVKKPKPENEITLLIDQHSKQAVPQSFKVPKLLITDHKFQPDDKENTKIHPVLGTADVRNIHDLNWDALKERALLEWSDICQEHYELVVKQEEFPSTTSMVTSRRASKTLDIQSKNSTTRSSQKKLPNKIQINLPPLKERSKASKIGYSVSQLNSSVTDEYEREDNYSKHKSAKKDKKKKLKSINGSKKDKSQFLQPRTPRGKIAVDDQSEFRDNFISDSSQLGRKTSEPKPKKHKKNKPEADNKKKDKKDTKKKQKKTKDKYDDPLIEDSMQQDSITMPQQNFMLNDPVRKQSATQQSLLGKEESHDADLIKNTAAVSSVQFQQARFDQDINYSYSATNEVITQKTKSPKAPIGKVVAQVSQKPTAEKTTKKFAEKLAEKLVQKPGQKPAEKGAQKPDNQLPRLTFKSKPTQEFKESIQSSQKSQEQKISEQSNTYSDNSSDSSDSDSSSESSEFEEDTEEAEQIEQDCKDLGVDLTKFLQKKEFYHLKEKVQNKNEKTESRLDDVEVLIETLEARIEKEINVKGEQYSAGVKIIEKRLDEHMAPVREKIDFIMKARYRQHSDDLLAQNRILERFNNIKKEFDGIIQTVTHALCPVVCCLLESQCTQLACEEQEDIDRLKIALYGHKEGQQKFAEQNAKAYRTAERKHLQYEKSKKNSHLSKCLDDSTVATNDVTMAWWAASDTKQASQQQNTHFNSTQQWWQQDRADKMNDAGMQGASRCKILDETVSLEASIAGQRHLESVETVTPHSSLQIKIPEKTQRAATSMEDRNYDEFSIFDAPGKSSPQQKDDFMRSIMESHYGETKDRDSIIQPHIDHSMTFNHQSVWLKRQPACEVLQLDQTCNCKTEREDLNRLFKVACLAYTPGKINYRNQSFTKQQLVAMRKFLIGQTTQLLSQAPIIKNMNLTTKKIFDDIYLHMENQARKNINISKEAHEQFRLIENDLNERVTVRSIFNKTKDQTMSLLESSIAISVDCNNTQDNEKNPYISSTRSHINDNYPSTARDSTVSTTHNPRHQTSIDVSTRNKSRRNTTDFLATTSRGESNPTRTSSVDTGKKGRNQQPLTTNMERQSEKDARGQDQVGGMLVSTLCMTDSINQMMLKGRNLNLDIEPNMGNATVTAEQRSGAKTAVFQTRRHSQQPMPLISTQVVPGNNRNLFGPNGTTGSGMTTFAKKAFQKVGCGKEQQKQYMNFVSQTSKNNEVLRHKLQSQPVPSSNQKKPNEPQKTVMAYMQLKGIMGDQVILQKKQTDSSLLDNNECSTNKNSTNNRAQKRKSLPPI